MERIAAGEGVFVTIEGPDGAGKSTQARLLGEALAREGWTVVLTREPGGTALGERVRQVLLDSQAGQHDPLADALLFNAARRQLVVDVIAPGLLAGSVVVCDRFTDSTLAYQGFGAGVPQTTLHSLAEDATGGLRPARTVLLDLAPDAGLARRAEGSARDLTRFELDPRHDLSFHRRVRDGYLQLAAEEPERWRVIDAGRESELVARDVRAALSDLLPGG